MFRRSPALTPPALLCLLAFPANAQAHRLLVDCHVLSEGKVQVESWFDWTGDSPREAHVKVLRADGKILTEGRLNDKGIFVFTVQEAEPLKIVVSAGAGHRAEHHIRAQLLAQSLKQDVKTPSSATAEFPLADRSSRVSIKDVLIGVAFLLALAAFVLSVRNFRQLRKLTE